MKNTKREAILANESSYFTGKPCKRGHVCPRHVSDGRCFECRKMKNSSDWKRQYMQKWNKENWEQNKEQEKERNRLFIASNLTRIREKKRIYAIENKDKLCQYNRDYHFKNPERVRIKAHERRAILNNATPPNADMESVKEFIKNCPKGFHVDHIIPLKGKELKGLHVIENLQYLTAKENLKKKNRIDFNLFPEQKVTIEILKLKYPEFYNEY